MPDDSLLVSRVKQRDPEALADFIERNRALLLGFLRSICSNQLTALVEVEDILQEVASSAIASLDTAPLDRFEPLDWVKEVARRRVKDAHRYHFQAKKREAGRRQSIHSPQDVTGGGVEAILVASITSPSGAFSRDVRHERMRAAVNQLPDEQKAAIQLRFVDGLPTKEIAARLGKTDGAVRVMLSRTLKQLEERLDDVRPSTG